MSVASPDTLMWRRPSETMRAIECYCINCSTDIDMANNEWNYFCKKIFSMRTNSLNFTFIFLIFFLTLFFVSLIRNKNSMECCSISELD